MAHMYPETGPVKETKSGAERRIYDLLSRSLGNEYTVHHAVAWQSADKNGRIEDGEVDFIVVHPNFGVLLIEVKGGGIRYSPEEGQWYSINRDNEEFKIKDPMAQVRACMHNLKRHLTSNAITQQFAASYRLAYAVWFPNVVRSQLQLGMPHYHDDIVLTSDDFVDPEVGLRRAYSYFGQAPGQPQHREISTDGMLAIDQLLAPTIVIPPNALLAHIHNDEAEVNRLTREQFEALDRLSRHKRLMIRGSAGTGKTILALDKARRFAVQGLRVLLLSNNQPLINSLRVQVEQQPHEISSLITVVSVRDLCIALAKASGIPYNLIDNPTQDDFGRQLRASISKLQDRSSGAFVDAILVDEGQDIDKPVWTQLPKLLRDPRGGYLYVFYDPAQRDGDDDWEPPIGRDRREVLLTTNCRNTQSIFRLSQLFYHGLEQPVCAGPEGQDVQFVDLKAHGAGDDDEGEAEKASVQAVLDSLIVKEGVKPEHILIITCKGMQKSVWYKTRSVGQHTLTWHSDGSRQGSVALATLRQAKGLERRIVILSELSGLGTVSNRNPLLYVAISRAMFHLVVIGAREQLVPAQIQPVLWTAGDGVNGRDDIDTSTH